MSNVASPMNYSQVVHVTANGTTLMPHFESSATPNDFPITDNGQSLQHEIASDCVNQLFVQLNQNEVDSLEDGGKGVDKMVRTTLQRAVLEIMYLALINPRLSHEDLLLTPFARSDGGAYLLVDYEKSGKKLSLKINPNDGPLELVLSSLHSTSQLKPINSTREFADELSWFLE